MLFAPENVVTEICSPFMVRFPHVRNTKSFGKLICGVFGDESEGVGEMLLDFLILASSFVATLCCVQRRYDYTCIIQDSHNTTYTREYCTRCAQEGVGNRSKERSAIRAREKKKTTGRIPGGAEGF